MKPPTIHSFVVAETDSNYQYPKPGIANVGIIRFSPASARARAVPEPESAPEPEWLNGTETPKS